MRGVLGHVHYQTAAPYSAWRKADFASIASKWYLCRTDLVGRFPSVELNASKRS